MIKKCFPLSMINNTDINTTAAPTTTTVNVTELALLQEKMRAANALHTSTMSNAFSQAGVVMLGLTQLSKNSSVDNTTRVEAGTMVGSLQTSTNAVRRRRKRQISLSIPETCIDAQNQLVSLAEQLYDTLSADVTEIMSVLDTISVFLVGKIETYPGAHVLSKLVNDTIKMFQDFPTTRDTFASAVRDLTTLMTTYANQLCVTSPGQTTTIPTTLAVDLGNPAVCRK